MKTRKLMIGVITSAIMVMTTGCDGNKEVDKTNRFDRAIVQIGGEWTEMKVAKWTDFEDGDQIQIKTPDGTVYLVHSTNITLIHDPD